MRCERRFLAPLRGGVLLSGLEQFRDSDSKPLELLGMLVIQGHTGPEVVDTDVAAGPLPLQKDDGKHVAGEAPQQSARPVRKHDRSLSREVPLEGLQRLDQIAHVGVAEGSHRGVEGHAGDGRVQCLGHEVLVQPLELLALVFLDRVIAQGAYLEASVGDGVLDAQLAVSLGVDHDHLASLLVVVRELLADGVWV